MIYTRLELNRVYAIWLSKPLDIFLWHNQIWCFYWPRLKICPSRSSFSSEALTEASLLLACKLQGSDRRCQGSIWIPLWGAIDPWGWEVTEIFNRLGIILIPIIMTHDIPGLGSLDLGHTSRTNTSWFWCPFTSMVSSVVIRCHSRNAIFYFWSGQGRRLHLIISYCI